MELLKSVLEGITRNESECMKDDILELDVLLTRQYTHRELLNFIKHHNIPRQDYANICTKEGIKSVETEDAPAILDYVKHYTIPLNFYDDMNFSGKKDYSFILDWISCDKKGLTTKETQQYIIVPENIRSLLNIVNIREFITEKTVRHIDTEDLFVADDCNEIVVDNVKFTVVNSTEKFTSEDWDNIRCIFLDGTSWQYKQWTIQGLVEIFEKIPCFYVYYRNQHSDKLTGYNVTELVVDEKTSKLITEIDFNRILLK